MSSKDAEIQIGGPFEKHLQSPAHLLARTLVTEFRFTPAVPEPSAWLLLGTVLASSFAALKRLKA